MSDHDDGCGAGIGALAAWQLGRWSAESDAENDSMWDAIRQRRYGRAVDVNQLLANNLALAAENERLRQQLADYKHNYRRLKEWADEVEPVLAKLRTPRN